MISKVFRSLSLALVSLIIALGASSSALGAATIVILNADGAGEGFNDPTVVAPVGGNPGTTLGQQRLNVFQAAANIWGATLTSTVTITIQAQFNPLTCNATSAVLGSAGAVVIFRDFGGAPFTGTWYNESLTDKLLGVNADPSHEINATFNSNLGQAGCLTGTFFYLGLDNNHGTNIDLETVLLHEFGHGLGFQTFTSGSTGVQNSGFPTIYDRFLVDNLTGKNWLTMTNAERAASAIGINRLAWNGPTVGTNAPSVLGASPIVRINSPAGIAGNYPGGPAQFGPALTSGGVTGNVVQALDPADGPGPTTTDGCTALTNAAAVAGNIAIIDRGTCGFIVKVKNAQNAGAIGVIIADNAPGSPPPGLGGSDPTITIPSERVTQADGNTIKANLGTGVNATLRVDPTIPAGTDPLGKALLYSPNPFAGGSSVSHWDVSASPNQLMEPNINADLTHSVTTPADLTLSEMTDIGWVPTPLPSTISQATGNNQGTLLSQPFLIPFSVTTSPAVAGLTVTWTSNPSAGGAGGTFPSTGTRIATSTTDALGTATAPQFDANGQAGNYSMNATIPGAGTTVFALKNMLSPTAAPATISGAVTSASGEPLPGVTMRLAGGRSATGITDSNGNYHFDNVDTEQFYTVTPVRVNYNFSPVNRSFSLQGNKTDAVFTAIPDAVIVGNAIDTAEYFVRQHYLDFLGREPDESGFNFWSDQILGCGDDAGCVERKRINVSAAYFLSSEFQRTGGLVDSIYRSSFGRRPQYAEFVPDALTMGQGVVVTEGGEWQQRLAANKRAFADAFVSRAAFREAYDRLTNGSYVDQLIGHTGVSYPQSERDALANGLNNGDLTRAEVLLRIAENDGLAKAKRNEMFVMMEYFAYLRRDPDESGYQFWLNKLNHFEGNFERAEMVKAFINSGEYRARFAR